MRAVLVIVSLLVSAGCAWRGRREWKRFRCGRGRPLLDGVSPEQLATIPAEWPLSEARWPPPQAKGAADMDRASADAYARLAARVRTGTALAAEVLGLVGGAWLGVTLKDIWVDYHQSSTEATRALRAGSSFPVTIHPSDFVHLLPVVPIVMAMGLLILSRDYGDAERCYDDVARSAVSRAGAGEPRPTSAGAVRRVLRRLLS